MFLETRYFSNDVVHHYYDEFKEKEGLSESELASYYVQMAKVNKWNKEAEDES
ncbi:MAG: hypothetical protein L0L94_09335 [Staphylococcus equorum]|nr:hypothetical protein [Staphylococcus equorum]